MRERGEISKRLNITLQCLCILLTTRESLKCLPVQYRPFPELETHSRGQRKDPQVHQYFRPLTSLPVKVLSLQSLLALTAPGEQAGASAPQRRRLHHRSEAGPRAATGSRRPLPTPTSPESAPHAPCLGSLPAPQGLPLVTL